MKVLIFVPQSREIRQSLDSIKALDTTGLQVALVFDQRILRHEDRWDRVTAKYQAAREILLADDYDALFCIEDDIIVPPDALHALAALDADVAYGLVVARHRPYQWSATLELDGYDHCVSLDMCPSRLAEAWGQVIDTVGCGLFCTLIPRHVLEAVPFRRGGRHCCDWDFALDCRARGFTQKTDLRVICGHVSEERGQAIYPDPAMPRFYRWRDVDLEVHVPLPQL